MFELILRKCVRCGREARLEHDLALFVPNLPSKYHKQNLCRDCNHEIHKEYHKEYKERNKKHILPQMRKHFKLLYLEHRQRYIDNARSYRKHNPEKKRAHNKVKRQPTDSKCSNCGSTEFLVRHHPDYSLPNFFITLCSSCHRKYHVRGLGK